MDYINLRKQYKEKIEELLKKYDYASPVTVIHKEAEKFEDIDEFSGEKFEIESNECLEYDFEIKKDYFPKDLSDELMDLSYDCLEDNGIELFPSDKMIAELISDDMVDEMI